MNDAKGQAERYGGHPQSMAAVSRSLETDKAGFRFTIRNACLMYWAVEQAIYITKHFFCSLENASENPHDP